MSALETGNLPEVFSVNPCFLLCQAKSGVSVGRLQGALQDCGDGRMSTTNSREQQIMESHCSSHAGKHSSAVQPWLLGTRKGFALPKEALSPARGVWKWCKFSSSELCISGCFEPCTEHLAPAACPGSLCILCLSPEQIVFHQITALLLSRTKILRGICYSVILICP